MAPYVTAAVPTPSIPALVKSFMHMCNNDIGSSDDEEADGVDLCNCEFSLAYGVYALDCCRSTVAEALQKRADQFRLHFANPILLVPVWGWFN